MVDLVTQAEARTVRLSTLASAVVTPSRVIIFTPDGALETLDHESGRTALLERPHLMVSRALSARRLGVQGLPAYDILELFAFTRPARFCLPTVEGVAEALAVPGDYEDPESAASSLPDLAGRLLADLASETYRYRAGSLSLADAMARSGWLWGPLVVAALDEAPLADREDGLQPWRTMPSWDDEGPLPPPGDESVGEDMAEERLADLLGDGSETRDGQRRYARAATHAFRPREMEGMPNLQILEAGTGTGKTLGYIAPASRWAELNDGPVWLSTYTKNLQRQLDQELTRLYPDPRVKARRAVIRKGRENYACLLNIEETQRSVAQRTAPIDGEDRDRVLMGLVLRWVRYSRDGDMIGGDFPSWLGMTFGMGRVAGLTDRRGECLHTACPHYGTCFIERAVRASRHADLVVANHALVMSQAVMRKGDPDLPKRLVFDEGHHMFDAADSSFSLRLSGLEGMELRRWIRGKESGGQTRARGLQARLDELVSNDNEARALLGEVLEAARILPSDGWAARVQGAAAMTSYESFLMMVRAHIFARTHGDGFYGLEAGLEEPSTDFTDAARALDQKLDGLVGPMRSLARRLVQMLDEEAEVLEASTKARLEAAARSLALRADMVLGWREMLGTLGGTPNPVFVDWAELDRADGRERDIALCRHFLDPSEPLAKEVLSDMHGVVVTSATLRDRGDITGTGSEGAPDWRTSDMRTGAQHLPGAAKRLAVESPFDYSVNSRFIVVTDVSKQYLEPVVGAFRALFTASGGGALGLFTAISRLRSVYEALAPRLEAEGVPLLAQHVDAVDVATLIDMFRASETACLLGTDAVRDGVDVPGQSLRLIVFDRVPWPRPTLLHKARRSAFGGRAYDEMLTRLKITQAFGRLIRRKDDRGVFVILDGQTPSRLLTGLPEGVHVERMELREAVEAVRAMQTLDDQPPTG